jgi:GrpB-like predicted nucleotidyltransferase (UPF0157 family)
MQKYIFSEYNLEFPSLFEEEKTKIKNIFKDSTVEHVGSTAVPNLGGKGILDIAVGVLKSQFYEAKEALEKCGYEYREVASTEGRLFFRIDYPYNGNVRRVHLHLMEFNCDEWKKTVGFRDYLRNNEYAKEEYAKIKREGVDVANGDGEKYRKHKHEFILDILKKSHVLQ